MHSPPVPGAPLAHAESTPKPANKGLPEPGMVFLSGGSALNETASALASLIPTTHIITTFDSGGSTAALRKVLPIPAVGDIRSRLLALADTSMPGVAALVDVLKYRLPLHATQETHCKEFQFFAHAAHPLMLALEPQHRERVAASLEQFMTMIPPSFQWGGASIGNLVLAADYFSFGKHFLSAMTDWADRLHVRGTVLPVTETPAHLAVRLENGSILVGQHRFTGKWEADITSPIEEIWLTRDKGRPFQLQVEATASSLDMLSQAKTIIYPLGSFFSSVAANMLVKGVGQAIANARCRKIFIPNPGRDPELCRLPLMGQVEFLLRLLRVDAPNAPFNELISAVLVDKERGNYQGGVPEKELKSLGIEVLDRPLVSLDPSKPPSKAGAPLASWEPPHPVPADMDKNSQADCDYERRIHGQDLALTLLALFPQEI